MIDKYYFYNGFESPFEIDPESITLSSNYLGDEAITYNFIEEHRAWINESDREYNEAIGYYGIYRNPTLEEMQAVNKRYCLDENDYLEEWKK